MFNLFKKKTGNNSGNGMGAKRKSLANISRNLQSGGGDMGRRVHSLPSFIRYLNDPSVHSRVSFDDRPPNLNPNRGNRVRYNRVQNDIVLSNGKSLRGLNKMRLKLLKNNRVSQQNAAHGDDSRKYFAMKNNIEKIQNAMYNLK